MSEKLKSSDLRIGNWLENFLGEKFQANSMTIRHFEDNEFGMPKPIPLTSEILLACGFEKGRFGAYSVTLDNEFSKLTYWSNEKCIELNNTSGTKWGRVYCDYLHQLQNLYFALTNQELEFKTELK